ncbi:hypothetical protein [Microbulbifer taiwanensis]|uniref:UbiA family prenyltransferase n=1 Tax=Microbulbifer taiwanensis TaxID=986746 RepID=A0ABW1YN27_9GAMM|nr:hypothetical protein [Microbulbifer taiwanensis]
MPEILLPIGLITILAVLAVAIDCYVTGRKTDDSGTRSANSDRLSDLALFAPFLALFYTENFWTSLACTLSIILITATSQWFCHRKGWLNAPSELITLVPGSILLTVVIYFIFFHDGFAEATPHDLVEANDGEHTSWTGYWVSALYFICFLLAAVPKKSDATFLSLLLLIPAITILPFFTGHYFWFMLLGLLLLLISVHRGFKNLETGSGGALSAVGGYFYMLAAFASIAVYAILY